MPESNPSILPTRPTSTPAVDGPHQVQAIAARAASAVAGVFALGSPAGRTSVRVLGRIPGARILYGDGVSTEVGNGRTAIDVSLGVEYGAAIPDVSRQVRRDVTSAVVSATALDVVEVNVTVVSVHHPDDVILPETDPTDAGPDGVASGETAEPGTLVPDVRVGPSS